MNDEPMKRAGATRIGRALSGEVLAYLGLARSRPRTWLPDNGGHLSDETHVMLQAIAVGGIGFLAVLMAVRCLS